MDTPQEHVLQFNAAQLSIIQPTSLEGIEKYLGSGLVKGIGPYFAKQLVKVLGAAVFDVIEHAPERLNEVPGIGKKRQRKILAGWKEQKTIREIMVFLQGHGLGTSRAFRIYKTYGEKAIEKVKENPYRLANDIRDIGFKTAEQLAKSLGLPEDSPLRARAGLQYALQLAGQEGHCALLQTELIQATHKLLNISESLIATAIAAEVMAKELIQTSINDSITLALKSLDLLRHKKTINVVRK